MKVNKEKAPFVCQIGEGSIQLVKIEVSKHSKKRIIALESEALPENADERGVYEKVGPLFKKLGYRNNAIIISLARQHATCRYLKIPSHNPEEIQKISGLQASRLLPYPASELVTGYETIQVDREGFSNILLTIVRKNIIDRYLNTYFKDFKDARINIFLNSYGLAGLYTFAANNRVLKDAAGTVMLLSVGINMAEIAIIARGKLAFSRYANLSINSDGWEGVLAEEVKKTEYAYSKEGLSDKISQILVLSGNKYLGPVIDALKKFGFLAAEFTYLDKINIKNGLLDKLYASEYSYAGLIGLGLNEPNNTLSLLPLPVRTSHLKSAKKKERLKIGLFIMGIAVIWFLGITVNLGNKSRHLQMLKDNLAKLSEETRPLERIEKRLKALQAAPGISKESSLGILHEFYRIIPENITLISLSYEEGKQVLARGLAGELNSVLSLVAAMENSSVFQSFSTKIRYASKKNTIAGEMVEFEIICVK